MTDPQPDFRPVPGRPDPVARGVRRILAPNPSPMTFRGTNTYLVGDTAVAIIDPGPDDPAHLEAVLAALGCGARVSHILVTHPHLDHSSLARVLSARTGAPVLAYGAADAGRRPIMQALAQDTAIGGGEGVDHAFAPDETLPDGGIVETAEWCLEAVHLPGHMGAHLGFALNGMLFSGDVVMGWASSLISPPDGDLTAFLASLDRLEQRPWSQFLPGHGAPIAEPAARIAALRAHRAARTTAILDALSDGPATVETLTARIYTDTPASLLPAAARNVLAHLIALLEAGEITAQRPLSDATLYAPATARKQL